MKKRTYNVKASEGVLRIRKLSKSEVLDIMHNQSISSVGYMFDITNKAAAVNITKRMKVLNFFEPKNRTKDVNNLRQPFSKNEDDYGTRELNKKFNKPQRLPIHYELKEVIEHYKISIPTN